MTEAARYYRELSSSRQAWQEAIRYNSFPDEEWDLTLASQRPYGSPNEPRRPCPRLCHRRSACSRTDSPVHQAAASGDLLASNMVTALEQAEVG